MALSRFTLNSSPISLSTIGELLQSGQTLALHEEVCKAVLESRSVVDDVLTSADRTYYGINTGFGKFADVRISAADIDELQRRLVLSHAAGVGAAMPDEVVRAMILAKIISLSRGYSGIRLVTLQLLIDMFNARIIPLIPEQGSVGASGDLAPLAHLALVLIGQGRARYNGTIHSGAEALTKAGLKPIQLRAKEGLAILNGTQASAAFALHNVLAARRLIASANCIGALGVEALNGTPAAFHSEIHRVRGQLGQQRVAAAIRTLLRDSEITAAHRDSKHRVQDAYCLRCIPQVHGAVRDALDHAELILTREINGVTDNPLVFAASGEVISGGNFHAEPLALVMDYLAIALTDLGNIAERRIAHYLDSTMSELPPFLVTNGGLNSGFMMAHVTAAALTSENKSLAHPASVDTIPTSANKEDHVSMSTWAARKCRQVTDNLSHILAIELLCAVQALDLRRPLRGARLSEEVYELVRGQVPFWENDREMGRDIATAKELLQESRFIDILLRFELLNAEEK
jgi:histidine ammonia-lyase